MEHGLLTTIFSRPWSENNLSLIHYIEVYPYLDEILFDNFSSGNSQSDVEFKIMKKINFYGKGITLKQKIIMFFVGPTKKEELLNKN